MASRRTVSGERCGLIAAALMGATGFASGAWVVSKRRNVATSASQLCSPDGLSGATHQPPWTDKQINWIAEKGRLIPFDGVADELKYPADGEQRQRPSPPEEKQRPRDRNHWDGDRVTELIQWVLMPGLVVINK